MIRKELLEEALDWAALHGVLRMRPDGVLTHAPFALTPASISDDWLTELKALTDPFQQLMVGVAADVGFLREHLEPSAQTDPFLKLLLSWLPERPVQPKHLLLQRNDFFLVPGTLGRLQARQVELNTISASFPFLAGRVHELHQLLLRQNPSALVRLVRNHPLEEMAAALAEGVRHYDHPEGVVLMVVQPNEGNRFDQRGLEEQLLQRHGVVTLRRTLEQVAEEGEIREGHLWLGAQVAAVTYYRAAYAPQDLASEAARKGRERLEASATIQCPSLAMQLAGMKKVQQVLGRPEVLSRFLTEGVEAVQSTFAGLYALDEEIQWEGRWRSVREVAAQHPDTFVLKPQREGGGNNFFGAALPGKLKELTPEDTRSYILMERLHPQPHTATLVVERQAETRSCVSEYGFYGTCLAEGTTLHRSEFAGTLVRTKGATVDEGGVSAGYACLNSLMLEGESHQNL